jgi:hypothetical protein
MRTIAHRVFHALAVVALLLGGAQLKLSLAQSVTYAPNPATAPSPIAAPNPATAPTSATAPNPIVAPQPTSAQSATAAQNPTPAPSAQAAPASMWLVITEISVKPEMMAEYQNFVKNTTNPALKKAGVKWREVWQNTSDAFGFVLVSQFDKFADFDGPSPLEKALGSQGFAEWTAKAGTLVKSVRRYIVRTRPDLSAMSKPYTTPKLAVVTSFHVAVNRNQDFENYVKNDYLPVMNKAGATYLVSQNIFGGDANEYVALTLRDSFAELDKGPITIQVLGAEGAQTLMQKMPAGTVTHIERSIVRFVPELSIIPAEMPK